MNLRNARSLIFGQPDRYATVLSRAALQAMRSEWMKITLFFKTIAV